MDLLKSQGIFFLAATCTVGLLFLGLSTENPVTNSVVTEVLTHKLTALKEYHCACHNRTTEEHMCNTTNATNTHNATNDIIQEFLVPNIVHYIWYMDESIEMRFDKALSVMSAAKNIKPDAIYFHTNNPPHGKYFDMLKRMPMFKIVTREPPRSVFRTAHYETTYANYDRVKVLLEYGGIYLDFDVMVIQSFDDLRKYRCTMGYELPDKLCAGSIICGKNEPFLHIWLNSYYDDYRNTWAYNSGQVSTKLARRYPDLIHTEPRRLNYPNWQQLEQIWGNTPYPWKQNYAVHTWIRLAKLAEMPTEDSIKTYDSTYGEIARSVYYGTWKEEMFS